MCIKVGFVGAPGSGKTSTARDLAAHCRKIDQFKRVELTAEYARRYIHKYGIDCLYDQIRILEKQTEWENSIPSEHTDIMITDSPIFLGWVYSLELRKQTPKDVMTMNDIFKKMSKLNMKPRYDIIFHLPLTLKPVADGIRPDSNFKDEWRKKTNDRILATFDLFPPVKLIHVESVALDERTEECLRHIESYIENHKNAKES